MEFATFLTSLLTSFLIFLVLMLLFTWLSARPGNHVIYYPNRILKGLDPTGGSRTRNPFTWIQEALSSSEQDVISISGVDTAVYFVFLSTALGIFVLSAIVLLPVLIPVAVTDDGIKKAQTNNSSTFSEFDYLTMGNVNPGSNRLWAFLVTTYWVSFVAYYLTWKAYNHVSILRAEALMTPELKAEQFAIIVRDIPPVPEGQTRKEQIDSFFRNIYPDTFYQSMIVTDNREVNKLWEELEGYNKKLKRSKAVFATSKAEAEPGVRPTHRTSFLGLVGKKVDSIEFYSEKINELVPKLESEQKTTLREKQKNAVLVFFNNRATAAFAAQNLHTQMVDKWTVLAAPEARQLIWRNLYINSFQRQVRQYVVLVVLALMIFFYMIAITIIPAVLEAFTTLENLKRFLPFFNPDVNIVVYTVLKAYLPQIVLIIFLAMLSKLLLFLSKSEGVPSEGHAVMAASRKFFYFTVLNVFLGVTLSGEMFRTFIRVDPSSLIPLLASSLPGSATFFLTYVALKFFVGYGLELSRIVPLIIFHLKKKFLCKCEADVKDAWTPEDLGYGTRVPGDLFIFTIVLCYSIIAPLIVPFGIIYFGLGWLIHRNQALKVHVPPYETYGRIWPHIFNRIMASLLLYQLVMFGFFGVEKFFYAPILIPLPIISLIFASLCHNKFYRAFADTALEVARNELNEVPNIEQVFKSFIPPSLSFEKVDDDRFEDAQS